MFSFNIFLSHLIALATTSSGFSLNSLLGSIMSGITGFFDDIMTIMGNVLSGIGTGFTGGMDLMFQGWGNGLASYGVWGPLMIVVSIGVALIVGYIFIDITGDEKDLGEVEADL